MNTRWGKHNEIQGPFAKSRPPGFRLDEATSIGMERKAAKELQQWRQREVPREINIGQYFPTRCN